MRLYRGLLLTILSIICIDAYSQYSPKLEKDLVSLTKTFGYIRYFYAGDEAASIDWNRFAYYAADNIIKNKGATDQKLKLLFTPIAPAITIDKNTSAYPSSFHNISSNPTLQPVYWQHLGDGNGSVGYPYKSLRVNRPARVLPESQNDFSGIRKALDIPGLKGKEIRASARFRADAFYNGHPFIAINVKETGKDAVEYSTRGQKVNSSNWETHTISSILPGNIDKLTLLIQNIGMMGSIEIDEVVLEVKEEGKWRTILTENFSAIDNNQLQEKWRPYGVNQEIELAYEGGNSFVKISRTKGRLQLVEPLFNNAPPANTLLQKKIADQLFLHFPLVLQGDSLHTYPIANNPDFQNLVDALNAIQSKNLTCDHLATRIANVMLLWTRIQHFYPEFDHLNVNWERQLEIAIRSSFTDTNVAMHRLTLTKMLAPLKDSHMSLYYSTLMPEEFRPPIRWEWIENKLVITAVLDNSKIQVGDIVKTVNNIPADQYWRSIKQQVTGATDSRRNFKAIDESLNGAENSTLAITLSGKSNYNYSFTLNRSMSEFDYDKALSDAKKPLVFEEVAPSIFYINLNKISWSDLEKRIPQLDTAKGLIFDIRNYPMWETFNIISYLSRKRVNWYQTGIPAIIYPDRERMTIQYDTIDYLEPKAPYLKAKRVFLTGGGAISLAEDFVGMIEGYELAEIVGEPTAGTTGGINMCYLLGGLVTPWTGKKILRHDGTSFNATTGIVPKHRVSRTIEGIRNGKDEYLEYTLKNIFRTGK